MPYRKKKDKVWEKGMPIPGKDPKKYRQDSYGNELFYGSYGKQTKMGWTIDHSKPQSRGGTHHLNNLRPLQTKQNQKKGNKY